MALLTEIEFTRMEHLLAGLLKHADADEEQKILEIHQRLEQMFETQEQLRRSKDRLAKLTQQTEK